MKKQEGMFVRADPRLFKRGGRLEVGREVTGSIQIDLLIQRMDNHLIPCMSDTSRYLLRGLRDIRTAAAFSSG